MAPPLRFNSEIPCGARPVADGTGTCRIAPILLRLRSNRQFAESFLGQIEQHESRALSGGSTTPVHELAHDQVLAVRSQLQIFRRTRAAQDVDIAVHAALHQCGRGWSAFPLRERRL